MGKEKGRLVGRPFALDIQQRTSQHLVDPQPRTNTSARVLQLAG